MLDKLFRRLYTKVYINIIPTHHSTVIYIKEYNGEKSIYEESKSFDTTLPDKKILEFINSNTAKTPYYYISVLDNSKIQGALPTCNKKEMQRYIDINSIKYRCYENNWAYYTSKPDFDALLQKYNSFGVDFIFSPFIVISKFFKDKIDSHLALYALVQDDMISIGVFKNSKLLYGENLDLSSISEQNELVMHETNDDEEEDLDLDSGIDLEEIDALNDIESLDDFGNIEDLDSIDEIDEFDESANEILEESLTADEKEESNHTNSSDENIGMNNDYNRFILIQNAINKFYKDSRYESEFIEHLYIADSIGNITDLKHYLEEEMFLSVYMRRIDLSYELCEIARLESTEC